jgi:hypothetical protein
VRAPSIADVAHIDGPLATAGNRVSTSQFFCPDRFFWRTARALAPPGCATASVRSPAHNSEFAEYSTREILETPAISWSGSRRSSGIRNSLFAAGFGIATQQMPGLDGHFISAFTTAHPIGRFVPRKGQSEDRQFTKHLTCKIPYAGATAGCRMTASEITGSGQDLFTAFATAVPANPSTARIGTPIKHRQFAEYSARQIFR